MGCVASKIYAIGAKHRACNVCWCASVCVFTLDIEPYEHDTNTLTHPMHVVKPPLMLASAQRRMAKELPRDHTDHKYNCVGPGRIPRTHPPPPPPPPWPENLSCTYAYNNLIVAQQTRISYVATHTHGRLAREPKHEREQTDVRI